MVSGRDEKGISYLPANFTFLFSEVALFQPMSFFIRAEVSPTIR